MAGDARSSRPGRPWCRRKEAARYFGIAPRTLSRWRESWLPRGSFLVVNSRTVLFRVDVIEEYLRSREDPLAESSAAPGPGDRRPGPEPPRAFVL